MIGEVSYEHRLDEEEVDYGLELNINEAPKQQEAAVKSVPRPVAPVAPAVLLQRACLLASAKLCLAFCPRRAARR